MTTYIPLMTFSQALEHYLTVRESMLSIGEGELKQSLRQEMKSAAERMDSLVSGVTINES